MGLGRFVASQVPSRGSSAKRRARMTSTCARAVLREGCCRRLYTIFPRLRRSQADRLGSPTGGACFSTDSGRWTSPEAYEACTGVTNVSVTNWARSAHMTCLTYSQTYARTAYTAFFAHLKVRPITNHVPGAAHQAFLKGITASPAAPGSGGCT